ncbi:hypothetical protein HPB50_006060 [Hyalomma asiaticum]|uniref:Uncharacterized protein n=1 Tax=Hyalomma asiaticum TaxID=266040 RepID=A0ACB7SEX8_HYAAI|nr:hypothetical protein HPB50_006060 [Hyalomma asiaticum]
MGLFVIASTVYTIPYFDKYQAFASSMKFGTWGLAGIIGPFIVSRLILMYGLSGTLLMFGAFNLQTIPIIMLAKNPQPLHIRWLKSHNDTVRCNGLRHDPVISYGSRNSHETPLPCGRVKELPTSNRSFSVSLRHTLQLFRIPWFYVFLVTAVVGDYSAIEFGATIVDYGMDKGIEANKAKLLTTFVFSGELLGRLVLPLFADVLSLSHRSVYAFSFSCTFACMTSVPHVSSFAGVVALCLTQGIAEGYCLCMKYVLLADILGVENVAASFGAYGIAMVPLSVFTPKIIARDPLWTVEAEKK